MLRDVDRGAAVLAAEGEALQQAEGTRMTGARTPICAYVGRKPTRTVARPMTEMVTRNVYFRPMMSPSAPKKTAPNGRTRNPAAYVANADSSDAVGLSLGKKIGAKNGARVA